MPADGLLAKFSPEERKSLAPHVARLWNKWMPWVEVKWKDELLAAVALATILGARKEALDAKKKAEAEAAQAAKPTPERKAAA